MTLPTWWSDIVRSGEQSLEDYENVLGLLEKMMTKEPDLSSSAVRRRAAGWSELVKAAEAAAARLSDSRRLADARRRDAETAGHSTENLELLEERASRASNRGRQLAAELRTLMSKTATEINNRHPRRPAQGMYRNPTASHVNLFA